MTFTRTSLLFQGAGEADNQVDAAIEATYRPILGGLLGPNILSLNQAVGGTRAGVFWNNYALNYAGAQPVYLQIGLWSGSWGTNSNDFRIRIRVTTTLPTSGTPVPTDAYEFTFNAPRAHVGLARIELILYTSATGVAANLSFNNVFLSTWWLGFTPSNRPSWYNNSGPRRYFVRMEGAAGQGISFDIIPHSSLASLFIPASSTLNWVNNGLPPVDTPNGQKQILEGNPILSPSNQGLFGRFPNAVAFTSLTNLSMDQQVIAADRSYRVLGFADNNRAVLLRVT